MLLFKGLNFMVIWLRLVMSLVGLRMDGIWKFLDGDACYYSDDTFIFAKKRDGVDLLIYTVAIVLEIDS